MRERILLAIAAVAAFAGGLTAPFVFDDLALLGDPVIASRSGLWESWKLTQTRPLAWFTFWANYQAGTDHAWGYHAVNLALHVAVVLLLWDVLRRLVSARAALIAAAIFAAHPLLTEPVVYVFARPILLATLFSLLAVRAWIQGKAWLAAGWFFVAMLAKEECAAVPAFLLLLDLSQQRKMKWRPLAAMFGMALALGLRVIWALSVTRGAPAGAQAGISPLDYLAVQGVVILTYLRMFVVPWGFSVDYEIARSGEIVAWIVVAALAVLASRRFRNLGYGFWFLAGLALLAPSSSIFPAADLAADRRMYLPMIAFSAGAAVLLARVPRIVPLGIIVALCGISIYYTSLWRSPQALWAEALKKAPDKLRPRVQLARALGGERGLEVLRAGPSDPRTAAEEGRLLLSMNRPAEALSAFGRALAFKPNDAASLNNRGAALLVLGQAEAARGDFERALEWDPCLFDARFNLLRMGVHTHADDCRYTSRQQELLAEP